MILDEHILPSYKSIYGRLRRAKKESGSSGRIWKFLKKFYDIVFSPGKSIKIIFNSSALIFYFHSYSCSFAGIDVSSAYFYDYDW
jgi:hypothetical protein